MSKCVYRSIREPLRSNLSFEERWRGFDRGLITCWEIGRRMVHQQSEIARAARRGELPPAGWKGGVDKPLKMDVKIGTLFYLAQWQGMRGEDLELDLDAEPQIRCSRTAVLVRFTGDAQKYGNA